MKILKLLAGACFALIIVACSGEPRIDASSMEKFESSVMEVAEHLTPERQAEFEMALTSVMLSVGPSMLNGASEDDVLREVRGKLHKKTADDIIREYGQ